MEESADRVEWMETSVGVIPDIRIAEKVKGKVHNTVVRPAMIYSLEMVH